jgi:hypothetical protein
MVQKATTMPSTRFCSKKLELPILEHFKDQSPNGKAKDRRSQKFHSLGHE